VGHDDSVQSDCIGEAELRDGEPGGPKSRGEGRFPDRLTDDETHAIQQACVELCEKGVPVRCLKPSAEWGKPVAFSDDVVSDFPYL
jgi:hypothetical protein